MKKITTIRRIDIGSITVAVDAVPELDTSIRDCFDPDTHDVEQLERDVENGRLAWFAVRVTVTHRPTSTTLGTDYLGSCLYESFDAFNRPGGYMHDMIHQAIQRTRGLVLDYRARRNETLVQDIAGALRNA